MTNDDIDVYCFICGRAGPPPLHPGIWRWCEDHPKPKCNTTILINLLDNEVRRLEKEMGTEHYLVGGKWQTRYGLNLSVDQWEELVDLLEHNTIARINAAALMKSLGGCEWSAKRMAEEMGLLIKSDGLEAAIGQLVAENPKALQDYLGGKDAALGNLVGTIMRRCSNLDPRQVRTKLQEMK